MTGKADFSEDEWHLIAQGPPAAGMIVIMAQRGGTFRETFSMAKSYTEARKAHGASELLDEIVSSRPQIDRSRAHSPEEQREHGLQHLRDAVALLAAKAPGDLEEYRRFTIGLAKNAANAHREDGSDEGTSDAERAAIDQITSALG
jgi:hypothetical protein